MTIQELLKNRGFDTSKQILLVRHAPKNNRKIFDENKHDKKWLLAYQSAQVEPKYHDETGKPVDYLITFVKGKGNTAIFIGVYQIFDVIEKEEYDRNSIIDGRYIYKMEEVSDFEYLSKKITVEWTTPRKWIQPVDNKKEIIFSNDYDEFEKEILAFKNLSYSDQQRKMKKYEEYPTIITRETLLFKRNPQVIIKALKLADGRCEHCQKEAPFIKTSDNEPYLEVHHIIPLSKNGKDTLNNAIALCPNCHRNAHYGGLVIINNNPNRKK